MELDTPLAVVSGIGPTFAKRLTRLNLFTVEDLLNHYPFRYENFSQIKNISMAKSGEESTFRGQIWSIKNSYTRFKKVITKAILNDGTASLEITWFNQPWLIKNIKTSDTIQISGKTERYHSKIAMIAPEWEKIEEGIDFQNIHTGRIVPVYPETYGIKSKWLRNKIIGLLRSKVAQIEDPLPEHIYNQLSLFEALQQIHFPDSFEKHAQALEKLSFDELFYIQLNNQKTKLEWRGKKILEPLNINPDTLLHFINNLPFELTSAQKKVIDEIIVDLKKNHPMNRLIQGDVGSGKTVVAAAVIYLLCQNKLRSVLMAPTEILAFQHFQTLTKLFTPYKIKVDIYTGSKKFTKNKNSTPDVIVGTHALLSKKISLDTVGLVIIDEQQRFGVEQRSLLRNKAKLPHFLTMTATPIPRTVALTLYGDLDLSIIDELPKGRKVVRTHFVPSNKRSAAYNFITQQVNQGQQVYIITPLIEESETQLSAKAVKVEYERLQKEVFPDLSLGILHGKMKSKEKEEVLGKFKNKEVDILVSTSVVEVGVDVPNATIMVVEGAERFGLAQLHQLRGRVGRGTAQSYTFLFTETENRQNISRVKNLEKIYDGLKLAELDLKIRGAGEVFGIKQSGSWDLKIASFSNLSLVERTKKAAEAVLKESSTLDKYPKLKRKLVNLDKKIMPD